MPTYGAPEGFYREFDRLPPDGRRRFLEAVRHLIEALERRPPDYPPRLRVKRVQGHPGVWELSFAADGRATFEYGRATFEYGDEIVPGEAHVVWRRVGDHSVLRSP